MMGENYLYVNIVAKRLKCSERTVYRMINEGRLKAIRIGVGRALRVPESDFEAFISASVVDADDAQPAS